MNTRRNSGLTIVEVLLIMVALGILVALILPLFARAKVQHAVISCSSNLKQVGLAFRMWAYDNGKKFPMELLSVAGGTRETLFQGPLASFNIISNELNNPKPLTCRHDEDRTRVTVWSQLTPKNLSYFLGADATETNPYSILSGDRNLMISGKPAKGFVQITNPSVVTWGSNIHKHQGNIGLADGSAHQTTGNLLQKSLESTRLATNRFAVP